MRLMLFGDSTVTGSPLLPDAARQALQLGAEMAEGRRMLALMVERATATMH